MVIFPDFYLDETISFGFVAVTVVQQEALNLQPTVMVKEVFLM